MLLNNIMLIDLCYNMLTDLHYINGITLHKHNYDTELCDINVIKLLSNLL